MLGDVGETEIAGDQAVDQDAGSQGHEDPDGVNRPFAADNQERLAFQAAGDRCDHRVNGYAKRQQQSQRSHIFHSLTPLRVYVVLLMGAGARRNCPGLASYFEAHFAWILLA